MLLNQKRNILDVHLNSDTRRMEGFFISILDILTQGLMFIKFILQNFKLRRWLCPIKPMEGGGGNFHWFQKVLTFIGLKT